jgi:predicted PurR-regulated permease PerM
VRSRIARASVIGLAIAAVALLALLVYPIASALLFAAVLAGSFHPRVKAFAARLGGRRALAAAITTVVVAVVIVLPLTSLAVVLGGEAIQAMDYVRTSLRTGEIAAFIARLPAPLRSLVETFDLPQNRREVQQLAAEQSGLAAAAVGGAIAATSGFLIQVGLMLVAFYFLLVDGPQLVRWLADVAPIGPSRTYELLHDFRTVSEAVLLSSLATAGVQAAAALVGFLLTGVPQPVFFALVTFIIAFIPVIGAGSVPVALAVLLYFSGHAGQAMALAAWGVLVVGLADNLVKPLLMRGRMEIHAAVILFALVGGLAAFGPAGLAAGPLIVAFFLSTVRMWRRDVAEAEREELANGLERRSA